MAMKTMFKEKRSKRLIGFLLCITVICGVFVFTPTEFSAKSETPTEIYNRLKKELQQIGEQIKSHEGTKNSAIALRKARQEEKIILDAIIETQNLKINEKQTELEWKEAEVSAKWQSITENDALLQQRLVAIYKQNTSSVISTLLNIDDFSARNALTDGLRRISINDTELLETLSNEKIMLEQEEVEIQGLLAQLEEDRAQMQSDVETLAINIAALDNTISTAAAAMQAQQQAYGEKEAEYKEAEKVWRDFVNSLGGSNSSNSEYVGGAMIWPLNSNNVTITTRFGQNGHGGMDFSTRKQTGVSALAAGDGTIIQAGWHDHQYSYGNYVVIDHGGGIRTLYAHLNQIYVSGGSVSKGTPIGEVGNTGYSFGIHLHFEVHQNGVRQSPEGWLKG